MIETEITPQEDLQRTLGIPSATAIVAGAMLGIGIFIIPPEVAALTENIGVFLGLWLVGGLIAFAGADAFAELGAAYPASGGDFSFQKRAFGRSVAFATGCVLFIGVFGGSIASVAVPIWEFQMSSILDIDFRKTAFALGHFECSRAQVGAIGLVILFTTINGSQARNWSRLQIVLTVIPLVLLMGLAIYILTAEPGAARSQPAQVGFPSDWSSIITGYLGVYFAYSGWNSIIYLAGEVRNPGRTLPISLLGSTALVTGLYFLLCWSFIHLLGMAGLAKAGEAGTAVATQLSPSWGGPVASVLIALALLASLNATIMGGARIAFAMAQAGVAWSNFGRVSQKNHQPVTALWVQAGWVIVLIFSGTFSELIQLTSIAMLVTGSLTVLALFKLRRSDPDRHRPYRSFCYPVFPVTYLLGSLGVIAYKCIEAATGKGSGYFPLLGVLILLLAYIGHYQWTHRSTT